jgi:hypothetical protein
MISCLKMRSRARVAEAVRQGGGGVAATIETVGIDTAIDLANFSPGLAHSFS